MAVLMLAGVQVPVTPLVDTVGSVGAELFWQRGPIAPKAGVTSGLTVTLKVAVVAHWPAVAVKVYVVVPADAVLIVEGFQLPVMLLFDVVSKAGAELFWQSEPIALKVGVISGFIVTLNVAIVAHWPIVGVNV